MGSTTPRELVLGLRECEGRLGKRMFEDSGEEMGDAVWDEMPSLDVAGSVGASASSAHSAWAPTGLPPGLPPGKKRLGRREICFQLVASMPGRGPSEEEDWAAGLSTAAGASAFARLLPSRDQRRSWFWRLLRRSSYVAVKPSLP